MAKIRAMIGSGGGGEALVETLLWTNPSPTSDYTDTGNITLSASISDFDYIKIVYNYSKSNLTQYSVFTPVDEFKTQILSTNNTVRSLNYGVLLSSGLFLRSVDYVSDTSVHISQAMRLNGSTSRPNEMAIPYKIYGVKKSSSGVQFKTDTFVTSSSGAVSVNVGFKPKYLDVVTYKSDGTSISLCYTYNEDISTTQYIHSAGDKYAQFKNLNQNNDYELKSIDANGFTVNKFNSSGWVGNAVYFAIG